MKIEEIVQWDMEFGVTIGPAGFDHRLRCPYCSKRLMLMNHEGGRELSGIRITYICEGCGAHSMVTFIPPGHRLEMPEVTFGERIVVERAKPVPQAPAAAPERSPRRERPAAGRPAAEPANSEGVKEAVPAPTPAGGGARTRPGNQGTPQSSPRPAQQRQTEAKNAPATQRPSQGNPLPRGTRASSPPQQPAASPTSQGNQRPGRGGTTPSEPRPSQPPRQGGQNTSPARNASLQELSETIQDQADKAAAKAPPYQRRRRRPFRPPSS